jgi:hypothetical protein
MNPHRVPATRIEDDPILPKGPSAKCPACAALPNKYSDGNYNESSNLPAPVACFPERRVSVGIFRRCSVQGSHLHERCKVCGHRWLTAFMGE